jgi:hypothetical protein
MFLFITFTLKYVSYTQCITLLQINNIILYYILVPSYDKYILRV